MPVSIPSSSSCRSLQLSILPSHSDSLPSLFLAPSFSSSSFAFPLSLSFSFSHVHKCMQSPLLHSIYIHRGNKFNFLHWIFTIPWRRMWINLWCPLLYYFVLCIIQFKIGRYFETCSVIRLNPHTHTHTPREKLHIVTHEVYNIELNIIKYLYLAKRQ